MAARFRMTTLLALAACALHAYAQVQAPPPVPAPTPVFDPGVYLAPLVAAERAASVVPAASIVPDEVRMHAFELQQLGMQRAFAGDTDGAIAAVDAQDPAAARRGAEAAGVPADAQAEDAIDAIVAQARTRRVVILNEAHHVPMHRAFAMRLAAALRKIGYTYLACETFEGADGDMSKTAPGQVTTATGFYTREATFANFVNAALADGWKLVAYEHLPVPKPGQDWMERIREREQGEADNLVARIFARDKSAKVYVYAGYSHAFKTPPGDNDPNVWMAERLRRATGLDVLSIDQTEFYAHVTPAAEHPLYAGLLSRVPSTAPFVLRAPDGSHPVLGMAKGRVDMQVIYPRYASHDGRPDWLRTLAGRSPHPIPAALLPKQGRRIVKALRVDAVKDAVPADVVLVEAGKPAPVLMLPPGEFRYVVEE
jgi:hypothetical protein